ncbi:MAG: PAS domain S-box protein, partial [Chthoniobacteraceae bacterium]
MNYLRNLPIRRKLMLVMMLATSVALLLSGGALLWSELRDFRVNLEASISTMARIVSSNSVAAISFDDDHAATETLRGLKVEPLILAAAIYRADGELFAQYARKGNTDELPPNPGPDGSRMSGHRMIRVSGLFDDRERTRVGTIYIVADSGGIRERIQSYAGLLALVMLTSALVALALSAMLQRYISAPILRLARATEQVARERDYSIRVPAGADDELGKLIDSFNAMLSQIESQDAALHSAHDLLEKRVEERTAELQNEVGERRRIEEEQAHSLSLVNATLESTADGILVVDGYGRVVSYNAKFAKIWRIPAHLLASHDDPRLVEFVSDQLKDPETFKEKIDWLYRQPEATSYDSIEFLDGRVFERYSMPQKIGGLSVGRVWSFRDISDRARSEECIREQASLLDLAQDAIVVRDMEDEILFWNKGAERVFGWKREEALMNRMQALLQSDAGKLDEAKRAVIDRGDWAGDLRHTTKAGREVVTESRWTLLRDPLGAPKSILMINTDVTERKKLESQFLRSQRLESLGTLAGGIAHDLNNVLAPILVSIELLRSEFDNPEADQILEAVQLSAQRGADLVSQILCFARGAEGKRVVLQPALVIKEVFKIARDTFPKNIEVRCTVPADVWSICGDATQLHQVLLNLCVNARDAMPNGGVL